MKRSGYRTIVHIYLLFFLSLLGAVLLCAGLLCATLLIHTPDGAVKRSDWPRAFTEAFDSQIIFPDAAPQIRQAGIESLQEHAVGIQILDPSGREVCSYQKPEQAAASYSSTELLQLDRTGQLANGTAAAFVGIASHGGQQYPYILYFPVPISKVTMYVNGERFAGGKAIVLPILSALLLLLLLSGVLYGIMTTKAMKRLTAAIQDIPVRRYLPVRDHGVFQDLYDSLNVLDAEIKSSDQLRARTEKLREEWIANITHDLKTPLSPIRGYAELLQEPGGKSEAECVRYAGILLKNVSYMEGLIDDLKLTYQLENGMLPLRPETQNVVRFLKELAIDILNVPAYETRTLHFESAEETIPFSFDPMLFTRAFRNLILNAFVHGEPDTAVTLRVSASDTVLTVCISDNGSGMTPEEMERLFDRYYRGTHTAQETEGSGLGLAIAKGIVALHGGTISVSSIPGVGTTFQMEFPRASG